MMRETIIAVGGIGIGYLLAQAVLKKKYEERLDEEVARTKAFFGKQYEGPDDPEFMEAAIDAAEALTEYTAGVTVAPSVLAQEMAKVVEAEAKVSELSSLTNPVVRAKLLKGVVDAKVSGPIAYNRMAGGDAAKEDVPGTPMNENAREPYLITFEDFDSGETGYEQPSVSFFAGDGLVLDETDSIITPERVEEMIGVDNLNRFGSQVDDPSMDPNVIYVRCEKFCLDVEVTRSPGKYADEVGPISTTQYIDGTEPGEE